MKNKYANFGKPQHNEKKWGKGTYNYIIHMY